PKRRMGASAPMTILPQGKCMLATSPGLRPNLIARRSWCQQGGRGGQSSVFRCSLIEQCFPRPLAEVGDQALLAQGPTRQADIAPVQDQPVVGMALVFRPHRAGELDLA